MGVQAIDQNIFPEVLGKTRVFYCPRSTTEGDSIQLFNGSAGNSSKYFSRGIGKDQSVLLPEVNDRGR